jgi:hypothetical protein
VNNLDGWIAPLGIKNIIYYDDKVKGGLRKSRFIGDDVLLIKKLVQSIDHSLF